MAEVTTPKITAEMFEAAQQMHASGRASSVEHALVKLQATKLNALHEMPAPPKGVLERNFYWNPPRQYTQAMFDEVLASIKEFADVVVINIAHVETFMREFVTALAQGDDPMQAAIAAKKQKRNACPKHGPVDDGGCCRLCVRRR